MKATMETACSVLLDRQWAMAAMAMIGSLFFGIVIGLVLGAHG